MDAGFGLALALALAFAVTNGFHDASNAIATLVATRAATPLQAIVLAAIFNLLGPLLVGAAVADTIGGIVDRRAVGGDRRSSARGSRPRSPGTSSPGGSGCRRAPGHALVGGLVGAALVEGGVARRQLGRPRRLAPGRRRSARSSRWPSRRVLGALAALAARSAALRRLARRATRRWHAPVRGGQWAMSAALAFSHGANDAQKSVGVIAALLLADGRIDTLARAAVGELALRRWR